MGRVVVERPHHFERTIIEISANNSRNARAHRLRVIDSRNEIRAYIPPDAASAHGEQEDRITRFRRLTRSHAPNIVGQPSWFTRAVSSGTLSVGAYVSVRQFPEIVDGVRGVARAATDTKDDQAA
jgi:hypothetical protein